MASNEKYLYESLPEPLKQAMLLRVKDKNQRFQGKEHLMYKRAPSDFYSKQAEHSNKTAENANAGTVITVGTTNALCNHATIQAAVNASSSGDTIRITNEFYQADEATFNVTNKSLTIIGGYNHCGTSAVVSGKTTLNGFGMSFADSVIELTDTNGGMNVDLFNIVMLGGMDDSDDGGGIEVTGFGSGPRLDLSIYNTDIFVNVSDNGGGIHATDANIIISASSRIQANSAVSNGGGIYCKNSFITIEKDSLIGMSDGTLGNDADSDSNGVGNGGGIYLDNCYLTLDASDGVTGAYVIGNSTHGSGGGISAKGGSIVDLLGDKAWVNLNQADFDGGGIFSDFTRLNIYNGSVNGNSARDGGGIHIKDETLVFQRNINYPCNGKCNQLSQNSAWSDGGGINDINATITLDGLWFEDNTAGVNGFAIQSLLPDLTIENCMILNNVTNNIGLGKSPISFTLNSGLFNLSYSTLAKNDINIGSYLLDFSSSSVVEVNLDSNIFYSSGGLNFVLDTTGSADLEIEKNVVFNYFSLPGDNISNENPEFFSIATNDFHITTASPAVDYGTNSLNIMYDIDNESRGLQETPDSGADEANLKVSINGAVCEYSTISAAIAAATDGDSIYIGVGNYIENLGTLNKSLTLLQANSTCEGVLNNPDASDLVIDGSNNFTSSGGVINIATGKTLTLIDLTIQNAKANFGGIIYAGINSTLVLDNAVIKGGSAKRFGGGIFSHGSVEIINGSKVFNNMATSSSGADAQSGGGIAITSNGLLVIEDDSIVSDNSAVGNGGGIFAEGSVTLMDDSRVFANSASKGGGVYLNFTTLTLMNTSAIGESGFGNNATLTGGGVHAENSTVKLFNSSIVDDNSAINGGGLYLTSDSDLEMQISSQVKNNSAIRGAGLYYIITAVNSSVANGQFIGNIATANGGAIYFNITDADFIVDLTNVILNLNQANFGAGLYYNSNNNSSLFRAITVSITNNTANSAGGGMYLDNGSSVASIIGMINGIVANNSANDGAGFYVDSDLNIINSNLYIADSFIKDNEALNGGTFYIKGTFLDVVQTELSLNSAVASSVLKSIDSSTRFTNVIMYGNTGFELFNIDSGATFEINDSTIIAETSTNVFNFNNNPGSSTINNTILSGFAITTMPSGSLIATCVLDSTGALGSTLSPLFINANLHDFHLQSSSNAINKCTTGESEDYESNPRPIGNGPTPYDIGAFEYQSIVDDDLIFANGFE